MRVCVILLCGPGDQGLADQTIRGSTHISVPRTELTARGYCMQLVKTSGGQPMQKIIFAIGATVLLSTTYTMAQLPQTFVGARKRRDGISGTVSAYGT